MPRRGSGQGKRPIEAAAAHAPVSKRIQLSHPEEIIDLTGTPPPLSFLAQTQPPQPPPQLLPQWQAAADEEPDDASLTQGPGDSSERELYGVVDIKIVGIQYYTGYATKGEMVRTQREPYNPYDHNAIRVNNVMGVQIGHIPRQVAKKLAPYLDDGSITIEAILTGNKRAYDCPLQLRLFGTSNPAGRKVLEARLKADRLLKAGELKETRIEAEVRRKQTEIIGQNTYSLAGGEDAPSLEELAAASMAVGMGGVGDPIKTMAMDEDTLQKMPMATQPVQLKAQLLPYQLQGLAWMMAKEKPQLPQPRSDEVVQLWKRDTQNCFVNMASNFKTSASSPPTLLSGGILADDMGLGKTLEVISLILSSGSASGPTLIVAPVTVMGNWEQQIRRHILPEHMLRVFIYHGTKKLTAAQVKDYDVIVTSYGKVLAESKMNASLRVLMAVDWCRVVLDEGHTIRNSRAETAVAACQLKAESRWILSGTPIVNSVRDLHSLLVFLRLTGGLEHSEIFNGVVARPLGEDDPRAKAIVQSIMRDLCLRRRKDMKLVDLKLPPKTEYIHRINFRPEEQRKYDALLDEAKGALKAYQDQSQAGQKGRFQGVLEKLLRLRQMCNHWVLCRERVDDLLKLLDEHEVVPLSAENVAILQQALQLLIESQEDCSVCLDNFTDPVITHCKHSFCRGCITRVIAIQGKCPMCRHAVTQESLVEPAPEGGANNNHHNNNGAAGVPFDEEAKSSKTEALVKIMQATLRDPGSKIVIFSQWTSFLDIIQGQVAEAGVGFTRIDGSMRADAREAAMRALETDASTRVLLASLGVCSLGLNLVAADTVVLADSWWAPAIEDQAVDRVHRLGQTRNTTVWRLIMDQTIEERVLDIQAEKRELVSQAFSEKARAKKSKETRMADLVKLLG